MNFVKFLILVAASVDIRKFSKRKQDSMKKFLNIFLHLDGMQRATEYLFLFSPNAGKYGENADQNNFKCGHFLRNARITKNVTEYRTYV